MNEIFGIDLGTTYSCISYVDEYGRPVVVPNAENERITPSVVFFDGDNVIVGDVAKENSKMYPEDVVSFVKRSMGDENFYFEHGGKSYHAEEISSFILRKLISDAENNLGQKISDVVITCPAYFGINEREATKLAGEIAGLNVKAIINEPTAAAVAYGVDYDKDKVVLVYDLGGGTFDITMIDVKKDSIKVICTGGDHNLGGKDWDDALIAYMAEKYKEITGNDKDILEDPETCQELQLLAERVKKTLSQREKAPISINYEGERAKIEITREKFNELTYDLLQRTISLTDDMLKEAAKKNYTAFDEILLVGGSSRMPQVEEIIKSKYSIEPKIFDPDEAVSKGAALYGWKLSVNDELVRRISEDTGKDIEDIKKSIDEKSIDEKIIETAAKKVADDTGYTLSAVKASNVKVVNVVSKSFGVVTYNNEEKEVIYNLIVKNSEVPYEFTERFGTREENQENVMIKIVEDELTDKIVDITYGNEIGEAELTLPENLPKNSPVDITFKLNEEGRLQIKAVEAVEKREISTSIETSSVIKGKDLEEAKERNKNIEVS
ncbi:Hsp70 family protein [Clostridium felsineum]|uniref:Chaperone protein DnaK n=1 Tax=Clostridium felsineum TaxID=36839 RepID=A0A1S8L8L8_9CLOT|nr:Hsp70 family protein [Clostridium felsineum]URZ05086.1 Chaperone protein DnaK [Clostridium felsineum]URZ10127.1 Chaperone protein DnaK [Clostridium felsineum]